MSIALQVQEQRGRVHVNFNSPKGDATRENRNAWIERLFSLGEFLAAYSSEEEAVHVYAYEEDDIGGLRISELDFTTGNGGGCYQRGCFEDHGKVIFAAELFLCTYGIPPTRPQGWKSCLNEHGESRCELLRAMGLDKEADIDYQQQLAEEKGIGCEATI